MTEESKRNEKHLTRSEERYKLILDNANDLITIINENLEREYINEKAYFELLGYKKEDINEKNPLSPLHPDDMDRALKALKNGFKFGKGRYELRVRQKDGDYLWLEHKGKSFIDTDGKRKAIIISRDITQRKRLEEIIIEENKKLMEISQIKSELVMRASHEFKTPLSSIYGASQILLKNFQDQLNSKVLGFVEMIYRGSQKLRQLIENLLDVSRVESGKLDLLLQKENLVEMVNECWNDLKYWAEKKNIKIDIKIPQKVILKVDRIRIEQVITNLLSNAIKYTPPGGKIYINLDVNNKSVDISIKDTGIGITKTEMEVLFQKFGKISRTSEGLNFEEEGTGLGLYISKEIIELHKGKILVESKGRNKGSTFTIRLPQSN